MSPEIHVCLLSCDRYEYTMRTARSFVARNAGFKLWHADDASSHPELRADVQGLGFEPLEYSEKRVGVTEMIRRLSNRLKRMGAEWLLLLENDWESVKQVPLHIFDEVRARDVWSLRLYGRYKEAGNKRPVCEYHRGRDSIAVQWRPFDGYEIGDIHWGNPPAVSKVDQVVWLHERAKTENDAIIRSGRIREHVARVVDNVVYHIGSARTPSFVR